MLSKTDGFVEMYLQRPPRCLASDLVRDGLPGEARPVFDAALMVRDISRHYLVQMLRAAMADGYMSGEYFAVYRESVEAVDRSCCAVWEALGMSEPELILGDIDHDRGW